MKFSPRLHPELVRSAWKLDDGRESFAEVWRNVGRRADELGLPRPGYHAIRIVLRAERQRRAEQVEALLAALEEALDRTPDGIELLDRIYTVYTLRRSSPWP